MGRMHAPGKGISSSAIPYRRSIPTWVKSSSEEVKEQIYKLAKKGLTPSQIGVILRDSHGISQVKIVTGNKILRILKAKGLAPDLPEDLYHMIKKAVAIRKHLERHRKVKPLKAFLTVINTSGSKKRKPLPSLCFVGGLVQQITLIDKDSKFRLILVESRIHRLARYYRTKRVLAPNWKYESSTASALVA